MPKQTEHNKAGHVAAKALGFKSLGPTIFGWRGAKVECETCGHQLPWYHRVYQTLHRERCTVSPAAPQPAVALDPALLQPDGWQDAYLALARQGLGWGVSRTEEAHDDEGAPWEG